MAVAELRTRLGMSQQEFSNRMGVALNTIARYESSREPDGAVLLRFAELATKEGYEDLAEKFNDAFREWIFGATEGSDIALTAFRTRYAGRPDYGLLMLKLYSLREFDFAAKFQRVVLYLRRSKNEKQREEILRALDSAVKAIDEYPLTVEFIQRAKGKGGK